MIWTPEIETVALIGFDPATVDALTDILRPEPAYGVAITTLSTRQ